MLADNPDLVVEVQDYNLPASKTTARMNISEVLAKFESEDEQITAINLLNLASTDEVTPWPLSKYCTVLGDASDVVSRMAHGETAHAGKKAKHIKYTFAADITSCIRFMIIGQAGSFSWWHKDQIGAKTWVTLEDNDDKAQSMSPQEQIEASREFDGFFATPDDEKVLKIWAFIKTPTAEEDARAHEEFRVQKESWKPHPSWIKLLFLIAGDTLVMPPGTIHAPITVTNAFFRGGMVWQKKFLYNTIKHWSLVLQDPDTTNENPARQSRAILDRLCTIIERAPHECGVRPQDYASLNEHIDVIRNFSLQCNCTGKSTCSSTSCPCFVLGEGCGTQCHPASSDCKRRLKAVQKFLICET
jgi:hypothetical protein